MTEGQPKASGKLLRARIGDFIEGLDFEMMRLAMGRQGLMGEPSDGVSDNISRLGVALTALKAVLEGTDLLVALGPDELGEKARVITFSPSTRTAEVTKGVQERKRMVYTTTE